MKSGKGAKGPEEGKVERELNCGCSFSKTENKQRNKTILLRFSCNEKYTVSKFYTESYGTV